MSREKVMIAAPVHPVLTEGLTNLGYDLVFAEHITQDTAPGLISDCAGVITSTRLLLDRDLIDAAPRLRWIGRMGSGMEMIDVSYAAAKGIFSFSSPEGNRNAVAEHAMGMLLSLTKRICRSSQEVKEGHWIRDANRGTELEGKTVGIIGLGNTGMAFAQKLSGFGVRILGYDKNRTIAFPDTIIRCEGLNPIFEEAEIISFHVPLQEDTEYYFNEKFLESMKRSFILINTSRGKVADTNVIHKGLIDKKISGACLDVLDGEPPGSMNREMQRIVSEIINFPEVIVTPHIAGYSDAALYKMSKILLDRIVTRT